MEKNGKLFISIVNESDFISSIWDPYVYQQNGQTYTLSHFATIQKPISKSKNTFPIHFEAIEYKDIPHGNYLSFSLRNKSDEVIKSFPTVGENELLLGTMRAYLGNILVTPVADWLGQKSPIYFEVKSEFVTVSPYDNLSYFWFAYLRSKCFLEHLPLGSGGTRPRLQPKTLSQTPVTVPDLEERKKIHDELAILAQREWLNCFKIASQYSLFNQVVKKSSLKKYLSNQILNNDDFEKDTNFGKLKRIPSTPLQTFLRKQGAVVSIEDDFSESI